MTGLRSVSSARLRCARTLWTIAERPAGSDLFPSKTRVGGGPSPTPAERVSRARRSTRPGVAGRPPAHGVCSSRGGGGASDSRALPEDFGQSVRNPPSADGERQSLYFAHAMCTDRDLVAGVARARLPYAANMVSGVDAAWVCAWRGAGSRGGSGGVSWHTL